MNDNETTNWQEMLPWYVNGTLDSTQEKALEAAMEQDDALKQEMVWLRQLQDSIQQQEQPAPPAELGWQRLKREIHREKNSVWKRWGVGAATAATVLFSMQMGMMIKPEGQAIQVMSGAGQWENLQGYWPVQVQFAETTSVAAIQQWAAPVQARIVDGPSALGMFVILIPQSEFTDQQTLEEWLEQNAMVEHAAVLEK